MQNRYPHRHWCSNFVTSRILFCCSDLRRSTSDLAWLTRAGADKKTNHIWLCHHGTRRSLWFRCAERKWCKCFPVWGIHSHLEGNTFWSRVCCLRRVDNSLNRNHLQGNKEVLKWDSISVWRAHDGVSSGPIATLLRSQKQLSPSYRYHEISEKNNPTKKKSNDI